MASFDSSEVYALAADLAAAPAKVAGKGVKAVSSETRETQRRAQRFSAVLTGENRELIITRAHGLTGEVIATSDHADYLEYGTSDTRPQPYMRPAAELAGDGLSDSLGDAGEDIL